MLEEWYTDQEVAAALKVGRSTLARWREQGTISYLKLPGGLMATIPSLNK